LGEGEPLNRGEPVLGEDDPFNNWLLLERFSRILFRRSLNDPITIPFDRGESVTGGLLDDGVERGGVESGGVTVGTGTNCSSCPPMAVDTSR
jgi:hypothetical protein